jgi:YidC/Oxa1 family membrane protein insertase
MGAIIDFMRSILDFFFRYTNSYGLAIISLTLLIKIVLFPLTLKQTQSMKKMKDLAPLQKELQEKYKNDKEKMNKELLKLYQEHKYNPMSGCFPLLVQFPILIAFFRLLQAVDYGQGFLWLPDLGAKDPYYILPVLAGLTTFLTSKQMSADGNPQTAMMNNIMPVFIGFISINFPSGLNLYWVVSNLLTYIQQALILNRVTVKEEA